MMRSVSRGRSVRPSVRDRDGFSPAINRDGLEGGVLRQRVGDRTRQTFAVIAWRARPGRKDAHKKAKTPRAAGRAGMRAEIRDYLTASAAALD